MNKLPLYAPAVLRLGLVAVFIWFGLNQLLNPAAWVGLIPSWITSLSGLTAAQFVTINGTFEIIAATLLSMGVFIRPIAILLCLHIISIIFDLGLTAVGVRDVAIAVALLSMALYGNDIFSCAYQKEHNHPLSER